MEKEKRKSISGSDLKKAMRIFAYIKPFRIKFSIGFLFLLLTALASLAFPKLLSQLMASNPDTLSDNLGLLIALLIIQAIASFFRILIFVDVTQKSLANIRQDVYQHLIRLPMMFYSEKRVGELNSRISADTTQIQDTLTTTLLSFSGRLP